MAEFGLPNASSAIPAPLNQEAIQPGRNPKFIDPVGYLDMLALEQNARLILTDSGGIQKEAYWLAVPCITLRDETEWVETVEAGWNVLTGANRDKILRAVNFFKKPTEHSPLYGDGQSAERCVQLLLMSYLRNKFIVSFLCLFFSFINL
jgi:UDP-N-acetylglucosamine 2-epimerase